MLTFAALGLVTIGALSQTNIHYQTSTEGATYTAAVLESVVTYNGVYNTALTLETARERIFANIQLLEPFIEEAANSGAEIVLLPEFGLTGLVHEREIIRLLIEELPDVDDNPIPCDEESTYQESHPTITNLSCIAREHGIFLAVNYGDKMECDITLDTCEDGWYQYNTQIVFNTNGQMVAKYWKLHTFLEPEYDTPEIVDATDEDYEGYVTFDLNGVEIGIITCYDSSYAYPLIPLISQHGIYNFIVSHWWVNDLPRMPAVSWFQSLSRRYGVNIMFTAGTHFAQDYYETYVPNNSSGSGIIEQGYVRGQYFNRDNEDSPHLVVATFEGLVPYSSAEVDLGWMGTIEEVTTVPEILGYNGEVITTCLQPGAILYHTTTSEATDDSSAFSCTVEAKVSEFTGYHGSECANWQNLNLEWAYLATSTGYFFPADGGDIYYFEQYCTFYLCNRGSCQKTPILDGLDFIYYGNYGFDNSFIKFEYIKISANFEPKIVKMSMITDGAGISIANSPDVVTYDDDYYGGDYSMVVMDPFETILSVTVLGRGYHKDVRYVGTTATTKEDSNDISTKKSFKIKDNRLTHLKTVPKAGTTINNQLNYNTKDTKNTNIYTYIAAGVILLIVVITIYKFKNHNQYEKYQSLDESNPLITQHL